MLKVPRGYENPIKTNMEKTNSALDTSGNTSWILTMNQTYESIYIRVSLGKQDQLNQLISKKRCRQSDSCNLTFSTPSAELRSLTDGDDDGSSTVKHKSLCL